jgi:hypothetical protein
MAFLAPLAVEGAAMLGPAAITAAEGLGTSLVGKEALHGLKKIANLGISHYGKEISPSKLLEKLAKKGVKTLEDPKEFHNVFEKGSKAFNVALGGARHLTGALHKHHVISQNQAEKWRQGLGKVNHGFHHSVAKLGKLHGHLLPFLGNRK